MENVNSVVSHIQSLLPEPEFEYPYESEEYHFKEHGKVREYLILAPKGKTIPLFET